MTKFFNISTDTTLGGNSPSDDVVSSQKAIKTLINTKQDTLVSGTNIKTVNNVSLLGSGNINISSGGTTDYDQLDNRPQINSNTLTGNMSSSDLGLQDTLVSGTNIKTINNTSLLGSGNITISGSGAVDSVNGQTGTVVLSASDVGAQVTLVSGSNIKTINNTSLLGSGNITIGGNANAFNLFDFKWSDHELDDMAWLRSDTFSWQPGGTYSNAYNHLVADATVYEWDVDLFTNRRYPQVGDKVFINNSGSATHYYVVTAYNESTGVLTILNTSDQSTEDVLYSGNSYTLSSLSASQLACVSRYEYVDQSSVRVFDAADGHKICLPDQESNVAAIYTATGVAWYYILDTANTRFKLPRTKFGFTGYRDAVGNYVPESLPNITVEIQTSGTNQSGSGAVTYTTLGSGARGWDGYGANNGQWAIDASLASSAYQNDAPVQQRATQMYLYFYVGEFTQTAIENTAGLNAELFNAKVDKGHQVIAFQAPTASNNYTWYRKYADGWIEQGVAQIVTGGGSVSVVLPVPMADTNYTILTSQYNSDGNGIYFQCQYHTPTATGFTVISQYGSSRTSRPFLWYVCGIAAS